MSMFGALPIAGSGAEAMQAWIDTSAGNVANMDDPAPVGTPTYGEQTPVLTPVGSAGAPGVPGVPGAAGPAQSAGTGVEVSRIVEGSTAGVVAYEPTNPLANGQGEVLLPNVSLGTQLVGMIQAQETYQADTVVMARAKDAYTAGLAIGS
ncbi:MAG: flagellar basal body rod protein FlgC [Acidimicrobiales bacterium]